MFEFICSPDLFDVLLNTSAAFITYNADTRECEASSLPVVKVNDLNTPLNGDYAWDCVKPNPARSEDSPEEAVSAWKNETGTNFYAICQVIPSKDITTMGLCTESYCEKVVVEIGRRYTAQHRTPQTELADGRQTLGEWVRGEGVKNDVVGGGMSQVLLEMTDKVLSDEEEEEQAEENYFSRKMPENASTLLSRVLAGFSG